MLQRRYAFVVGMVLASVSSQVLAGKLGGFEAHATQSRSGSGSGSSHQSNGHYGGYHYGGSSSRSGGNNGSGAGGLYASLFGAGIGTGLENSMDLARQHPLDLDPTMPVRELGDPIIPYFRLDTAYQEVSSDVEATDFYGQVGYGALGVDLRYTRFTEDHPRDSLEVMWIHVLGRFSYYKNLEVDIGAGMVQMTGNDRNQGFSFTMAALLYPLDWLGMEVRPTFAELNGNRLIDTDLSLHLRYGVGAIKFGYRWLTCPNDQLKGPYAGVIVRF